MFGYTKIEQQELFHQLEVVAITWPKKKTVHMKFAPILVLSPIMLVCFLCVTEQQMLVQFFHVTVKQMLV